METNTLVRILEILEKWKSKAKNPIVEDVKEKFKDPFLILVATILSLRTRDAITERVFNNLCKKVKNVEDLNAIKEEELEKLISSVGFYKNKVKTLKEVARKIRDNYNGNVPDSIEDLLSIKGVGRKTANLVLIEGFGKYGICVDTHVHRILNWWGYLSTRTPNDTEMVLREKLPKKWWKKINNILVTFGQNICKPKGYRCDLCPVFNLCTYKHKKG
ncbi:MAG: endonuclease III [Acidobacteria bacterium]|nr:endonuclease III [Acidobacteriota bacterium]